jgi:hypothetical protein
VHYTLKHPAVTLDEKLWDWKVPDPRYHPDPFLEAHYHSASAYIAVWEEGYQPEVVQDM